MIADPRFAPRRADLPWLRRRRLPKSAVTAPTGTASPPPLQNFLSGQTTGPHHHDPTPAAPAQTAPAPVPPPTPAPPAARPVPATSSLDLDAPSASSPPARPAASASLDLDAPTAPSPPARPAASASLDLDEAPAAPARPTPPTSSGPPRRVRTDVRVRPGDRLILTPADPTVTLTRLQSGIGALTIEALASAEVGDLRLGCAYEFDTGSQTTLQLTMQMTQGSRLAPPHSKRPVLLGSRDRFEKVAVDLRQTRALRRAVVYAFSEARQPLAWGGTLVVTTFGGGRVEVPMESLQGGDVAVLLSIYQLSGELVIRAEMQTLFGDVREASRAYGFDKITWLDDRTPVE